MAEKLTKERRDLLRTAGQIGNQLRVSSEAGVFSPDQSGQLTEILKQLCDARRLARSGDVDEAARQFQEVQIKHDLAVLARSSAWRVFHVYKLHIFLYQVVFLSVILYLGTGVVLVIPRPVPVYFSVPVPSAFFGVPVAAAAFGALGAILRSMWWFFSKLSRNQYYSRFLMAHLCAPWIGAIFGILVYLVVAGGLLALGGNDTGIENPQVPYALALIAGFKWKAAIDLMQSIIEERFPNGSGESVSKKSVPATESAQLTGSPEEGSSQATESEASSS
jgi:hypothetical protein